MPEFTSEFVDRYKHLRADGFKEKLKQDKPTSEQIEELFKYLVTSKSYDHTDQKENLPILLDHATIPNISQLFQSAIDGYGYHDIDQLTAMSFLMHHEKNPLDPNIFLQNVLSSSSFSDEEGKTKYDLIGKCLEKGAVIENKLTVFHDTGHAFVRLECSDCSKGKPVSMYVGFYPSGFFEDSESSLDNVDESMSMGVAGAKDSGNKLIKFSEIDESMLMGGAMGAKGSGKKLAKFSGVGGSKIMGKKLAEVSGIVYALSGVAKKGYSIHIEAPSFIDKPSAFSAKSSTGGYSSVSLRDMTQRSFNISAAGAKSVLDRVLHVSDKCDHDLDYRFFSSNCIDFAQDLYTRSGLEGDHLDVMYPDGYPGSDIGGYKFLNEVRSGKTNTGIFVQVLLATVIISMIAKLGSYVVSLTKTKKKEVTPPVKGSAKESATKDVARELDLDKSKKSFIPDKTPTHTKGRKGRGFC